MPQVSHDSAESVWLLCPERVEDLAGGSVKSNLTPVLYVEMHARPQSAGPRAHHLLNSENLDKNTLRLKTVEVGRASFPFSPRILLHDRFGVCFIVLSCPFEDAQES